MQAAAFAAKWRAAAIARQQWIFSSGKLAFPDATMVAARRLLQYQDRSIIRSSPFSMKGPGRVATAVSDSSPVAREAMIECQLKPCGVTSPRVAAAFHAIAREPFVTPDRRRIAYVDAPQPVASGRELLAPLSLGYLLQMAEITGNDRVLIVGTATGYSSAVVAELAGAVVALECDADLAAAARRNLESVPNIRVVEGPLDAGWAEAAPYDVILMDGAIEFLPPLFADQLCDGGRLLTILSGEDGVGRAARGIKHGGLLTLEPFVESPARILPAFEKPMRFQF